MTKGKRKKSLVGYVEKYWDLHWSTKVLEGGIWANLSSRCSQKKYKNYKTPVRITIEELP